MTLRCCRGKDGGTSKNSSSVCLAFAAGATVTAAAFLRLPALLLDGAARAGEAARVAAVCFEPLALGLTSTSSSLSSGSSSRTALLLLVGTSAAALLVAFLLATIFWLDARSENLY